MKAGSEKQERNENIQNIALISIIGFIFQEKIVKDFTFEKKWIKFAY